MSKRSLFWGQASGKLGEAVYYRAGGEQRTRTWVPKIKNPKSKGQATQRCLFMNMVAEFRALKKFVQFGFIKRTASQSAFNAFVKDNFGSNVWVSNGADVSRAEFHGYDMRLSNGSIPIDTSLEYVDAHTQWDPASPTIAQFKFNYPVAEFTVSTAQQNYINRGADIYKYLTADNNVLGLPSEFTLIIAYAMPGAEGACAYLFAVDCSAESTDQLRCIQQAQGKAAVTADEIKKLLVLAGGEPDDVTADTKLVNVEGIAISDVIQKSGEFAAALMIRYKTANGYDVTTSQLYASESFKELMDIFKLGSEYADGIIAAYTDTSNTL